MPSNGTDFSPLNPMNSWQSPPPSAFMQQPSPSASLFQRTSTSAFQPPTILSSPHPLTPLPPQTMLPIEPATSSTSAVSMAPVEEMIRVPKMLLAALINQCHSEIAACSHQDQTNQARPTVIVANKSIPLKCICRCRCGAKTSWSPIQDEAADKCTGTHSGQSVDSDCDSDSDSDFGDSISNGSCTDLALISSSKDFCLPKVVPM